MKTIAHKNELGYGIYTIPDISRLLKIERRKVTRYISEYWDERVGHKLFNDTYSWTANKRNKAVNFYVLIELHTFFELQKLGVKAKTILKARSSISKELGLEYPFASSELLTDGNRIWYQFEEDIVNADGTLQTNFVNVINFFASKVDFQDTGLAGRFWPFGKEKSIVVDPHHQFGQPVIRGTNVNAEVIYSMYKSGEPPSALAVLYDLTQQEVTDAIDFYRIAA
jgi:uncharacterized protein (DUF433 family)